MANKQINLGTSSSKIDVNVNGSLTVNNIDILAKISTKADLVHSHDDVYYTEAEVDDLIANHNHDSSDIISGTLSSDILPTVPVEKGGTGYTTIEDTAYTTARYRASSLHSKETTPTVNGVIAWYYE